VSRAAVMRMLEIDSLSEVIIGLNERVGEVETGKLGILDPATGLHGSVQSLTGAGAANLTTYATAITATGAYGVVTLADGALGQVKVLAVVGQSSPGDVIEIVPNNAYGFTKITLDALGRAVMLQWLGAWVQISGGTSPSVGPPTPEMTPEIEFVTADGKLFATVGGEQFVVQEV